MFGFYRRSCAVIVFLKHDRHVLSLAAGNDNNGDDGDEQVDKDDTIKKEVGLANKCPRKSNKL